MAVTFIPFSEYAADLAQSQTMRNAAFELVRLWRMNWDIPGSSDYQSYLTAYRVFADLMSDAREYRGSYIALAQEILKNEKVEKCS